mmetsp:Transcript_14840/g.19348  ORF Transcript_14840/g.19348 Transcript_14840/m.19348 type:complete len:111 (-) Transcript_14840:1159-1491(-)
MALSGNCTEKGCQQFMSYLLLQMEHKWKGRQTFLFILTFQMPISCSRLSVRVEMGPTNRWCTITPANRRKFHTPNDNQTPVSPYRAVRIFNAFNMPTVATTVLRERVKKD